MTTAPFRLPRRLVPLRVARRPLGKPEPAASRPLDAWTPGFSQAGAQTYLEDEIGCLPIVRPELEPEMPSELHLISGDELIDLHSQFMAFAGWLDEAMTLVDVRAEEEEAYLEHVLAEIRLVKAGTVKDKDAKSVNDPRYIEAQMRSLQYRAKAKLLKARMRRYDRCASALSREISRRQGAEPQ